MPPTDDENENVETKRIHFWVEADVPASFSSENLSNIAYSLAITAVRQVEHGETVAHGYETDDENRRRTDVSLLTEAESAELRNSDDAQGSARVPAASVLMVQQAVERVFPGADPLNLTGEQRARLFSNELVKDTRFQQIGARQLFMKVMAQLEGDGAQPPDVMQLSGGRSFLGRKRPPRGDA